MKNLVTPKPRHIDAAKEACGLIGLADCDHEFCAPQDTAPLADYALVVTAHHDEDDGVHWHGDLYRAGVKVLAVGNRGDGGPNHYRGGTDLVGEWRDEYARFRAAAREAFPAVEYEVEDCAVGFLDLVAQVGPL